MFEHEILFFSVYSLFIPGSVVLLKRRTLEILNT